MHMGHALSAPAAASRGTLSARKSHSGVTGAGSPGVAAPRASGGALEDTTENTDGEDTGDGSRFASPRSIARLLG